MSNEKQQWDDAYCLAEEMHDAGRPFKREELNIADQFICSRFSTIFEYDPYKDTYGFRNQELTHAIPVKSKCRHISDVDILELKKNTANADIRFPSYLNICPVYAMHPFTVLAFDLSKPVPMGMNASMENAAPNMKSPTEAEITPGTIYIFKHRDNKCYRCVILFEDGDNNVSDADRKYMVAFLDTPQVVSVKLKTLFHLGKFTIESYPCALYCCRAVGILEIRKDFGADLNGQINEFYKDKVKRKSGVHALIYKKDDRGDKLIFDCPSILGTSMTMALEIKDVIGHRSVAENDPTALSYDELVSKQLPTVDIDDHNSSVVLDLEESVIAQELGSTNGADCPCNNDNIDDFMQSQRQNPLDNNRDNWDRINESRSSMQSFAINQSQAITANPTPQPTFDESSGEVQTIPESINNLALNGRYLEDGRGTEEIREERSVESRQIGNQVVSQASCNYLEARQNSTQTANAESVCAIISESHAALPTDIQVIPSQHVLNENNHTVLPSVAPIIRNATGHSHIFGRQIPSPAFRRESLSSGNSIQVATFAATTGPCGSNTSRPTAQNTANSSINQDMSISNSSTNARLITIAQDNLNDTENWPNSEREQSATEMESGAEATTNSAVDEFAQVSDDMKGLADSMINFLRLTANSNNQDAFKANIFAMELISTKIPNQLTKRFFTLKIAEAKSLAEGFN